MTPPHYRLETGPARHLAGLSGHYTMATTAEIPALWKRFDTFKLPQRPDPEVYYGVCFDQTAEGLGYMCAVEVPEGADLPAEFSTLDLVAQTYAVFTHSGHISELTATWARVWQSWLPQSGLTVLPVPFYERYGPDFDPESGNGEVTIWIAVSA